MADLLDQEIKAFENMKVTLNQHHNGKFVVVKDGQLQGSFDTFENAVTDSVKRFGRGPYLIRQVGSPPAHMPASVANRVISNALR